MAFTNESNVPLFSWSIPYCFSSQCVSHASKLLSQLDRFSDQPLPSALFAPPADDTRHSRLASPDRLHQHLQQHRSRPGTALSRLDSAKSTASAASALGAVSARLRLASAAKQRVPVNQQSAADSGSAEAAAAAASSEESDETRYDHAFDDDGNQGATRISSAGPQSITSSSRPDSSANAAAEPRISLHVMRYRLLSSQYACRIAFCI
jgi:hypothetical protein